MFFTSSLLLFVTCTWLLSDCTAEDVYALVTKEAKLYFDYNQTWNEAFIENGGDLVVLIRKTSTNLKIWFFAGRSIIGVNYIDKTNQGMVTIRNVSSSYNGDITMYDSTSGRLLKRWHVHVLERPPANPIIRESSPPWAGQDYQLNCIGDSFGVTKYKWYKGGQLLSPDTKYNVTGNKLTIRNIQPEDSTKLTCVLFITDDIQSNNSVIFTVDVLYCTAEDVYALATKEAKLYFDYNLPWNIANIDKSGFLLATIEKISVNAKLKIAGKDGIGVKYIDKTNQGMVTIRNVSSSYTGNITMYDPTSGSLFKRWHVHVLVRPPANPIIRESSPAWAGQDYQLNCNGDSFGVTKYKWYKEGQLLTPDTKYNVTGNKLTIRKIQPEDSTNLTCVLFITDDIQSNNSNMFSVDVLCTTTDSPSTTGPSFVLSSEILDTEEYTTSPSLIVQLTSPANTINTYAIGVPIYVVIPMAIVTLVVVAYAIWIHQKRLTTLETDRPHSLEECDHELYITPIGGDIHLPIPLMNDGHASDSKTTQLDSCMLILHTNQNLCMDGYEMVDVSSIDAAERVCNSNETVYEPFETISKAVDDNCGYLTVLGVLETSV